MIKSDKYTKIISKLHKERWLEERAKRVTSSDASHLLGLGYHTWRKSPDDLALDKQSSAIGLSPAPTPNMLAGIFFEQSIINWFSEVTGLVVTESDLLYCRDIDGIGVGATPDGWVLLDEQNTTNPDLYEILTVQYGGSVFSGKQAHEVLMATLTAINDSTPDCGVIPLEVKLQPSKNRSRWYKSEAPDYYSKGQCQHHMLVTDTPACLLVAKVDAYELYCHIIEADYTWQQKMLSAYRKFYNKLLDN